MDSTPTNDIADMPAHAAGPALMQAMLRRYANSLWDDLDALSHAETECETKGKDGRTGTGTGTGTSKKPEWAIRLKAMELKLQYLVGRPMDRLQAPSAPPEPTAEDLLTEARRSPAYLQTLTQMLGELQGEGGGQ